MPPIAEEGGEGTWKARPAGEEEIDELTSVYDTTYGKSEASRYLAWKYFRNPFGRATVWVAESGQGRIVGSLAYMPRPMRIQGKEHLTYHFADAMVLPQWQRKGIIQALFRHCFEHCFARGEPLVHMFPNLRSLGALIKLGLHPVGLVQQRELALKGTHLYRRVLRRLPAAAKVMGPLGDAALRRGRLRQHLERAFTTRIARVERFDSALAEAAMRALEAVPVHMVRTAAFLNWRFLDTPTGRHRAFAAYRGAEPAGYVVMESASGQACLSDLIACDEDARRDLLAFAVREAVRAGAGMLQSMALRGDGLDGLLARGGFSAAPVERLVPLMIRIGPAGESMRALLADPGAWYIHHGDRDAERMIP